MKKILFSIAIFMCFAIPVFSHGVVSGPTAEFYLPLFGFIFILIVISIVGKIKYHWGIERIVGIFLLGLFLLIVLFFVALVLKG